MAIGNSNVQYFYTGRGPLDTKALVQKFADLIKPETWLVNSNDPNSSAAYNGMLTAVWLDKNGSVLSDKNGVYLLFDPTITSTRNAIPDVTKEANWHKLAEVSDLAVISEKLPEIDGLASRTQSIEAILNGSGEYEGLVEKVNKTAAALAAVTTLSTRIVDNIPTVEEAKPGVIYLVADTNNSGSYIEYILVDDDEVKAVEQIGSTAIDLTGYVKTEDLVEELADFAKIADVVTVTDFNTFKNDTDAAILAVTEEISRKADIVALNDYYKISDANAKFASNTSVEAIAADLSTKADIATLADYYKKSEVNEIQASLIAALTGKADASNTYTKAEVNKFLQDIEGGSSESAASVARDLAAYISANDAVVTSLEDRVGVKGAGAVQATGLFAKLDETDAKVTAIETSVASLITSTNETTAKLAGITTNVAQAIEDAIKTVPTLEVATEEKLGGIKSGAGNNKVTVNDDGTASVASVSISSLTQDDNEILVLNGGSTSTNNNV